MGFKLFKNDDEHLRDAADLIKRKEYNKAVDSLRKAKSRDKDGDLAARCDAMEAVISLHDRQYDTRALVSAANALKKFEGELEIGLGTYDSAKLSEECLLIAKTVNCRNMPSGTSEQNLQRGNALMECAREYQTKIGNRSLFVDEIFGRAKTTGIKSSILLMAESNEAMAKYYEWEDPKKAAEHQQYAYNYRRQLGESGENNLTMMKRYSESATCWICGRNATGEGMHFFPMSSDISPQMRTEKDILRSANEGYSNIYVCRACHSAISRRSDEIASYYHEKSMEEIRDVEQRLQAEIAALQAQIVGLRFRGS